MVTELESPYLSISKSSKCAYEEGQGKHVESIFIVFYRSLSHILVWLFFNWSNVNTT